MRRGVIAIFLGITDVEKRAVLDSDERAGGTAGCISSEEPMAAGHWAMDARHRGQPRADHRQSRARPIVRISRWPTSASAESVRQWPAMIDEAIVQSHEEKRTNMAIGEADASALLRSKRQRRPNGPTTSRHGRFAAGI